MSNSLKITNSLYLQLDANGMLVFDAEGVRTLRLEAQLVSLLKLLVEANGEVVKREVFVEEVWDGNAFVGNSALTRNVYKLRKFIKDNGLENQLQIRSVPKSGYALDVHTQDSKSKAKSRKKIWAYAVVALLLFGYLFQFLFVVTEEETDFRITNIEAHR